MGAIHICIPRRNGEKKQIPDRRNKQMSENKLISTVCGKYLPSIQQTIKESETKLWQRTFVPGRISPHFSQADICGDTWVRICASGWTFNISNQQSFIIDGIQNARHALQKILAAF